MKTPSALCHVLSALTVGLLAVQAPLLSQGAPQATAPKFKGKAPVSDKVLEDQAASCPGSAIVQRRAPDGARRPSRAVDSVSDHHDWRWRLLRSGRFARAGRHHGFPHGRRHQTRSSEQIAQALDTMAASVGVSANEGSQVATLTGSALTDQFDQVLGARRRHPSQSQFSGKGDRALQSPRACRARRAAERSGLPERRALRESHLRRSSGGEHGAHARLAREGDARSARGFSQGNYVPDHAIIGVSGDITLAEARTKFDTALKAWAKSNKPRPGVSDPAAQRPLQDLARQQARLGADRVSWPGCGHQSDGPRLRHPDRDEPDSRRIERTPLPRAARTKGYTYGVYSALRALRYRGDWRAQMDVRTEVTEPSLRDLVAELAKMRDEVVPSAEFKDAQRSLTASFALSLENPNELLNLYIVRQLYNFPVDYWDRYTDRIAAVTPAQVQAAARKYLDLQRLQVVAVGDAAKMAPALRPVGPVQAFDDEGKPLNTAPQ